MLGNICNRLCGNSRRDANKYSRAIAAILLLFFVFIESSFCEEMSDCVAVSVTKGALMVVKSVEVIIPAKGMYIDDCPSAVFQKLSVRIHFLDGADKTVLKEYISVAADEGSRVAERVQIGGSIRQFIQRPTPSRNKQVPAGTMASGLFTIRKTAGGDPYALFLDPMGWVKRDELADFRITSDSMSIELDGQRCGVIWGLVNCSRTSSRPSFGAFMAKEPVTELLVGAVYTVSAAQRANASFTYVPPEYLTTVYQAIGEVRPSQPGLELRRMLFLLSVQSMIGDEEQFRETAAELRTKFPALSAN